MNAPTNEPEHLLVSYVWELLTEHQRYALANVDRVDTKTLQELWRLKLTTGRRLTVLGSKVVEMRMRQRPPEPRCRYRTAVALDTKALAFLGTVERATTKQVAEHLFGNGERGTRGRQRARHALDRLLRAGLVDREEHEGRFSNSAPDTWRKR